MTTLNRTASWVIIERETGRVICEVYRDSAPRLVNPDRYRCEPILDYLQSLNPSREV